MILQENPVLNKLYVAARVRDDIHQIDRISGSAATKIFTDDALEIFFDADHSGGHILVHWSPGYRRQRLYRFRKRLGY